MSKKLASLLIKINADGANAKRVMTEMEGRVDKFAKNMQKIGTTLTRNLTLPLTALASAGIALANTQLQAEAKLLTALKGREDIQKRLIAQASELQARSTYGDEEIIAQQAILAAMGLTEEQIKRTIQAATELSAALGMDLSSAVRNLGKTYGGLTGELGETIPALKDISAEALRNGAAIDYVNEHYQGFAQTAAETGAGPLVQLKNKLGDLGEKIGTVLMPALTALIDKVSRFVDLLAKMPDGLTKAVVGFGAFVAAAGPATVVLGKTIKSVTSLVSGVVRLATKFPAVTAAVATFGPAATAGIMIVGKLAKEIYELVTAADKFEKKMNELRKEQADTRRQEAYDLAMKMYSGRATSDEELERLLADYNESLERDYTSMITQNGGAPLSQKQQDSLAGLYGTIAALKEIQIIRAEERAELEAANRAEEERLRLLQLEADAAKRAADAAKRAADAAKLASARGSNTGIATNGVSFDGVSLKGGELAGEDWETSLRRRWDKWENEANAIATRAVDLGNAVAGAFTDMAVTIGEGLGNLFSGEEFDWGKSLLNILGNLLQTLGKELIVASGVIEKIRAAIATLSINPALGFIAGIAAVAAGTAMINLANKPVKLAKGGLAYGPTLAVVGDNPGAANDPEVVAPLSKLHDYVGGQMLQLTGDVEFVVRGDTMRAVLNRENVRLSRLG
jgi:hypothetical protein